MARAEARNALDVSNTVFHKAEIAKNESALALNRTMEKIKELEKFINNSGSTPSSIRQLASEVIISVFVAVVLSMSFIVLPLTSPWHVDFNFDVSLFASVVPKMNFKKFPWGGGN